MKKHLALLAATAVLGVTSAFAANPFSDVTPQDWAYQAVAQLASQGIVNGYPDGTFQGQHNITRYEMAQMVAKAMTRQDRVDAEQNAIINRLANEFSAELNNLGVRVAGLEDKVGNFKFTGDARMRYMGHEKVVTTGKFATKKDVEEAAKDGKTIHKGDLIESGKWRQSKFDYRGRVKFEATVNDNTKAVIRLVGSKEFGASDNPSAELDRIYVQHNFGKYATATVGRHDLVIGGGLTYDSDFDGASTRFGTDKLNAGFSYGYATDATLKLVKGDYDDHKHTGVLKEALHTNQRDSAQFAVFQVNGMIGPKVTAGAFYTKVNGVKAEALKGVGDVAVDYANIKEADLPKANKSLDFYGVYANADLGHDFAVDAEFAKFKDIKHSNAWTAGISYGKYSIAKEGSWMGKVQYFNQDVFAPVLSSTWAQPYNQNYKTWMVTGKYALAKNVGLVAYATVNAKDKQGKDVADYYRAELNYKF